MIDALIKRVSVTYKCYEMKKIGTKASQIIQVVYIVNPICFDSLKASGILRDTIA
jgi:hypothetical protein